MREPGTGLRLSGWKQVGLRLPPAWPRPSPPRTPRRPPHESSPLAAVVSATARALVSAQRELDARARASLVRWEEGGIPPTALTWSEVRLRCPVAFDCVARLGRAVTTALRVAPRHRSRATLAFTFTYLPWPQDEDDDGVGPPQAR